MARKKFKHLTKSDRLMIEKMLKQKHSKKEIAAAVGVDESTIYREIKRGRYMHTLTDLTEEERYSPDIAHDKYRENLKAKGPGLKIDHDQKLADYIEKKIAEDGYSPEAVLGEIKREGLEFDTEISKTTLYRYIDMGLFQTITNEDLPVKPRKKKKNKKVRKKQSRANAGESIEKRPDDIDTREEFGHWEMDTVVGKRGESQHSLLVLTERKTRNEIMFLLLEHTAAQVVGRSTSLSRSGKSSSAWYSKPSPWTTGRSSRTVPGWRNLCLETGPGQSSITAIHIAATSAGATKSRTASSAGRYRRVQTSTTRPRRTFRRSRTGSTTTPAAYSVMRRQR